MRLYLNVCIEKYDLYIEPLIGKNEDGTANTFLKVSAISDTDTVHDLTKKIKEAWIIKKEYHIKSLYLVLEDGKRIASSNDQNHITNLRTYGINRFSKLRYYDKNIKGDKKLHKSLKSGDRV